MAVSDTAANPLDNIRVVLVGTLYTGNVGSSCRAMANMGIRHLRLAAPNLQNSWEEGERLAVHATDILAAREEFPSLEAAVADCVAVVGTTVGPDMLTLVMTIGKEETIARVQRAIDTLGEIENE